MNLTQYVPISVTGLRFILNVLQEIKLYEMYHNVAVTGVKI